MIIESCALWILRYLSVHDKIVFPKLLNPPASHHPKESSPNLYGFSLAGAGPVHLPKTIIPDLYQVKSDLAPTPSLQTLPTHQSSLKKRILHIGMEVINVHFFKKRPLLQLQTTLWERVICFSEVPWGLADKKSGWRRHEGGCMLSSHYSPRAWKVEGLRPDKESLLSESIRLNLTYKQKVFLSNCLYKEKLVPS